MKVWNAIQLGFAAIGGGIGWFVGGVDGVMIALIAVVTLDYMTGVMCAIVGKKLSSEVGAKGIFKKVLIFALVGVAHMIDSQVIGEGGALRTAVIFFYLSNEGISVVENAARLGVPVPDKLRSLLAQLAQKGDKTMLNKFISYLEEQVRNHGIYVWGGQGEQGAQITEAWIRRRETSTANANRAIAFWRKQVLAGYGDVLRAFDCSGLGVYFLMKEGLLPVDTTADGLLRRCTRISQNELRRGDFVFKVDAKGKAYHVGYVVDDALNVIEAQGRDAGVIKSPLKGWSAYGRPPFFIAANTPAPEPKSRVLTLVKPYIQGSDVAALQAALKKRGYTVGTIDGVFGPLANKAVRKFQKKAKLVVDGKAGPKTNAALGLEWHG